MIQFITNHDYSVDVLNIVRLFYGKQEIEILKSEALGDIQSLFQEDGLVLQSFLSIQDGSVLAISRLFDKEIKEHREVLQEAKADAGKQLKNHAKISMYKLLSEALGKTYPWGILTGIRPIKIIHDLMDKGRDKQQIEGYMMSHYLVSGEKAHLAIDIAARERSFIYPMGQSKASVYIGIPFCPTRCHYCSFTSNSIKACGSGLVEEYLKALYAEMELTAEYMKQRDISVETIYVGGGTPTSVSAEQLDVLLSKAHELFGRDAVEFTCEAGRPDTITSDKLKVMKARGVTRISINPQTMNDDTLKRIGRAHSTAETVDSFQLARAHGFDNINMDIILGLPGEGLEHLENTLRQIAELNPESLTVHTMAIKRASILHEKLDAVQAGDSVTSQMMERASEFAAMQGMKPYYLYRQKHMVENLENIGYAKSGFECIYNMQIIEEKQTNIAFGADAITKTVDVTSGVIKRQANIKDIKLYTANIQQMIAKKLQLLEELYKKQS